MRWTAWANLFLASWLIFTAGTSSNERSVLIYSDIACGVLAFLLAVADIRTPRPWKKWGLCFIGVWLLFAPLIFWARLAGTYAIDTLIGVLLVVFSVAVPSHPPQDASEIPEGWSYNPSTWVHRVPVIVLALMGYFAARTMSSYQLGHISNVWDPFFSGGTETVLTSEVARAFPISDAGLGAVAYMLEALSGLVGDTRRWRTMPWMVYLFFILVVPAGVVSIVLIMLQPVVVGAWCTLCLFTALVTLISIPPAVDEIFASTQFLIDAKRRRLSVWKLFWVGDHAPVKNPGHKVKHHSLNGINFTPQLLTSALLGVALIAATALLSPPKAAADTMYVLAALVTTFAVLATAEPIRMLRYATGVLGLAIFSVPLLFHEVPTTARAIYIGVAITLVFLSRPKGPITERYGAWTSHIR